MNKINESIGVLIKASINDEKNNRKTESRIQRDLKELIDRHGSIFGSSINIEGDGNNQLQSFFIDEMRLTKRILNLIRADVDSLRFEDSKVNHSG